MFASIWSSRAAAHLDVALPYIIGGGEDTQTAAGWYQYLRRLHGSTYNTSTKSNSGVFALPSPVWSQFVVDMDALEAATTHNDGASDALQGKRVHEFLESDAINSANYRSGQGRELLEAWGARGTSGAGSTI